MHCWSSFASPLPTHYLGFAVFCFVERLRQAEANNMSVDEKTVFGKLFWKIVLVKLFRENCFRKIVFGKLLLENCFWKTGFGPAPTCA